MAITILTDVFMPSLVIEAGVRGKQMRKNTRVMTSSGAEQINIDWTQTLRQFEVGFVPMRRESWQAIEKLHEITAGGAYGFLMKDPKDQYVHLSECACAATGVDNYYHLYKQYTIGSHTVFRNIRRVQAANFKLYVNGVEQLPSVTVAPGNYRLNPDNEAVVQIDSAPAANLVTWQGYFYVPVHFMDDFIDWQMVVPGEDPDARFLSGPSCILQEVRE